MRSTLALAQEALERSGAEAREQLLLLLLERKEFAADARDRDLLEESLLATNTALRAQLGNATAALDEARLTIVRSALPQSAAQPREPAGKFFGLF